MPDDLRQPMQELELAWDCAAAVRSASTFEALEKSWRSLLNHLEKVWIKSERACQPFRAKFEPWQKPFRDLRSTDPLLIYLKQSRDADNHSIQDVSYVSNGWISGKLGPRVTMQFHLTEPNPVVGTVVNRGVTYEPPHMHLGQILNTRDPRVLSVHGCNFYADYLQQVASTFFRGAA